MGYLAEKNFEVTSGNTAKPVSGYSAADIEHLKYGVREKPGPTNSLGLVKFLFPNEYDVYMHSTNEPALFNLTRRDRSHGCVRLQHPDQMAVWVLSRARTGRLGRRQGYRGDERRDREQQDDHAEDAAARGRVST